MSTPFIHKPVMVAEVIHYLNPAPGKVFVDATVGGGGHSYHLLQVEPNIRLYAIDCDSTSLQVAIRNLSAWRDRINFIHANFVSLHQLVTEPVDGILFDLGLSSLQLEDPQRGFSFRHDGPLDMRFDTSVPFTAYNLITQSSYWELAQIIKQYGEERYANVIAKNIKQRRPETTSELYTAIVDALPQNYRNKSKVAARVFQALRIKVNNELSNLQSVLPVAVDLLKPGGRLVILSYHSLEDRIVKHFFKSCNSIKILTPKPIVPSATEIADNPRARSAKLRAAEKL